MVTITINAFWDFQGYGRIYRERFTAKYEFSVKNNQKEGRNNQTPFRPIKVFSEQPF